GARDELVRLWRLDQGKPKETGFLEQMSYPFRLAFAHGGQLLVSLGVYPVTARLWDFPARRLREELKVEAAHESTPAAVFSPDGKPLSLSTGREVISEKEEGRTDDTLGVYDVSGPRAVEKAVVRGHPTALLSLALSPDGKRLASAGSRLVRNAAGKYVKEAG